MFEIKNLTPFDTHLQLFIDQRCQQLATLIIKAEYKIIEPGQLQLQEAKPCIVLTDEYAAQPDKSAILRASDLVPFKPNTDVALNALAYSPGSPRRALDVCLEIGAHRIMRRVFGDRYWQRKMGVWEASVPEFFERQAIGYENAFGGAHWEQGQLQLKYSANPVGKGIGRLNEPVFEGLALPNIEMLDSLIQTWQDKPSPAALGFVASHWSPRFELAGTYDEDWQALRAPLLPLDFKSAFYNCAAPQLQLPRLQGGELVKLHNLCAQGFCSFMLPRWSLMAHFVHKGEVTSIPAQLDTLLLEPEKGQVFVTWRATFNCLNQGTYLRQVVVEGQNHD